MTDHPHILLVEDDRDVAAFVERGLVEEGYRVTWLDRGEPAPEVAGSAGIDLVLLDVRLPGESGHSVCRRMRDSRPTLPIVMLTALDAVEDRVAGLRAGADDYLGKPFAFEELLARIEANLRRTATSNEAAPVLRVGDLELDVGAGLVSCGGAPVSFTPREYALTAHLMRHSGEVRSRAELHRDVWGNDFDRGTNLINVYVNYVRTKLREAGSVMQITTVRGTGYRLDQPGLPAPAGANGDGIH